MTPQAELRIPEEIQALVGRANENAQAIEKYHVTTPEEYEHADEALRRLKQLEKTLDGKRKWMLDPLAETTRRINDFFRAPLDRIKSAKTSCDQAMVGFRLAQQRKAQEEQQRQAEIIRKEQARLEAQAAKERAEAEAKAADLRRRAEEAVAAGKAGQAAKLASQAEARLEAGQSTAAALQTAAESMPAPQVEADIPQIAGSHSRKSYKAREKKSSGIPHPVRQGEFLTPLEALVCAVAKGINDGTQYPPVSTLLANDKVLNQFATSLKEHFSFPGYELAVEESTVSRGR